METVDCDLDINVHVFDSLMDKLWRKLTQAKRSQQDRFTTNLSIRVFDSCVKGLCKYTNTQIF